MSPNLNESLSVTLNPAHEDADGSDAAHEDPSDDDPSNAAASRAVVRGYSVRDATLIHHPKQPLTPADIANKGALLDELEAALGPAPADGTGYVDYVFVECVQPDLWLLPGWGLAFGHAAVCYKCPQLGLHRLVNVTRGTGEAGEGHLIDVWERPEDYIAGSKGVKGAGGLFSRSMCVVRVHGVDAHAVRALDLYYQALASSFESAGLRGKIAYERAVLGDVFLWLLGLPLRQHGNCSQWVSRGLWSRGPRG